MNILETIAGAIILMMVVYLGLVAMMGAGL